MVQVKTVSGLRSGLQPVGRTESPQSVGPLGEFLFGRLRTTFSCSSEVFKALKGPAASWSNGSGTKGGSGRSAGLVSVM